MVSCQVFQIFFVCAKTSSQKLLVAETKVGGGERVRTSVRTSDAQNRNWVRIHAAVKKKYSRNLLSEVPRNLLTRWDGSSILANGIFLTKKLKNKNKNAQQVEND